MLSPSTAQAEGSTRFGSYARAHSRENYCYCKWFCANGIKQIYERKVLEENSAISVKHIDEA